MNETKNKQTRTISVSIETHEELIDLGRYNETMDNIVQKCVKAYKENKN